ncbi:hypothetical protein SAMN04488556_1981 [Halostagnicola kamekurae]|uniref:Uncharacterized protein n=1 Tax=Halostagnicola kamekurae TaxID=619731 RepID=A0A1I6RQA2_9EURY|nr:hypothetical protein SAMN04488556_1981 [Halostagnicola kamekurae]
MINRFQTDNRDMATEENVENATQLDEAMKDIRQELIKRVAAADRDENRDIYDALENE